MKRGTFAILALLLAAAGDVPLAPGLWEVRNTPGIATLNGRALHELPLGEIKTQRLCVTATEAADPGAFFSRDTAADCTIGYSVLKGGHVAIDGTCPGEDRARPGTLALKGHYTPTSYDIAFVTIAHGDDGTMTFSGRLTGQRVGACPASH